MTYYKENPKTWRYDDKIMIQAILISLGNFSLFNPRQASPCYLYHYLIHCYIRRKQYIRVINTAFLIIEQWKWFIPVSASSSFIDLFDDALSMIFDCFKLLRTAKPPNEFPSPLNLLFFDRSISSFNSPAHVVISIGIGHWSQYMAVREMAVHVEVACRRRALVKNHWSRSKVAKITKIVDRSSAWFNLNFMWRFSISAAWPTREPTIKKWPFSILSSWA